jgi:hypothetical protein
MARETDRTAASGRSEAFHHVVFRDIRGGTFREDLPRDFRDLYRFYVSEDRRAELARMGRVRRAIVVTGILFKNLILKLSPARRILLFISLYLWLFGAVQFRIGDRAGLSLDMRAWSYVVLLVVVMLEMKDKLLARDEIAVARQVQMSLLPREHPVISGWKLWSATRPANDVGGDLVDYLTPRAGRVGVALGDVAGKGLGAALLMAKLQATLRALAPATVSLADLGHEVNSVFCRDGLDNRFASLFYAEIEPDTAIVRFLNAGHNPALVARASGLEPLAASGLPLGMLATASYAESTVELEQGDLIVIYSDGLTEARNERGEEFGEARLREIAAGLRDLPLPEAGGRVLAEVAAHVNRETPHDDLSLILIRRVRP